MSSKRKSKSKRSLGRSVNEVLAANAKHERSIFVRPCCASVAGAPHVDACFLGIEKQLAFGKAYGMSDAKLSDMGLSPRVCNDESRVSRIGVPPDVRAHLGFANLLRLAGRDPADPDLMDTPNRAVKAFQEMTSGHKVDVATLLKTFDGQQYSGLVVVGPIKFYSLCEHHLLPFYGSAWVGYLPNQKTGRIVGLSKVARLVEAFAKRLQVQERLTHQIAQALVDHLDAHGAGCLIEAQHLCMMARGVEQDSATMRTQTLLGEFMRAEVRAEFDTLMRR